MAGKRYTRIPKTTWASMGPALRGIDEDLVDLEAGSTGGGGSVTGNIDSSQVTSGTLTAARVGIVVQNADGTWPTIARATGAHYRWKPTRTPITVPADTNGAAVGDELIGVGIISAPSTTPTDPGTTPSVGSVVPFRIGGGGFVTSMSISNDGTKVISTDTAGALRAEKSATSWTQVLKPSLMSATFDDAYVAGNGASGYAVAPTDSKIEYVAMFDSIWRRTTGSGSWTRCVSGILTRPNTESKLVTPRLVVDPANASHALYGSIRDGLWRTTDGVNWSKVSLPVDPVTVSWPIYGHVGEYWGEGAWQSADLSTAYDGYGVSCVSFDRSSALVSGRTSRISVAVQGRGVYTSTDAGVTWAQHPGQPRVGMTPTSMTYEKGGTLFVATPLPASDEYTRLYAHEVWKVSGSTWTNVTIDSGYERIVLSADPTTAGRVALMMSKDFNHPRMFRMTTDNGATWPEVTRTMTDGDTPWLTALFKNTPTMWMTIAAPAWDPSVPGRLWVPEGVGVWQVDVSGTTSTWRPFAKNLENLVITDVSTNPQAVLLAGWDRKIWRVTDQVNGPLTYLPNTVFSSAWSVHVSPTATNVAAASIANHQDGQGVPESGYSTDYGATWKAFPTVPKGSNDAYGVFGFGQIVAKSATEFLWIGANRTGAYYTKNAGSTWSPVALPNGADPLMINDRQHFIYHRGATIDTTGTYYAHATGYGVFKSADGGSTWVQCCNKDALPTGNYWYHSHLKAVPNRNGYQGPAGHLFLTGGQIEASTSVVDRTNVFAKSTDGGASWYPIGGMKSVAAFGFGPPMPGKSYATLLASGFLNGSDPCLAVSTDGGNTWTRVFATGGDTYAGIVEIDGDWTTPGKFYATTSGMGVLTVTIPS